MANLEGQAAGQNQDIKSQEVDEQKIIERLQGYHHVILGPLRSLR